MTTAKKGMVDVKTDFSTHTIPFFYFCGSDDMILVSPSTAVSRRGLPA